MNFRVLHHDRCFDGACSAAVFTKFHRECVGGAAGYEYGGLAHTPGGVVDEGLLGAGENAIVDFKYVSSPRLTWWFDHHASAFKTEQMRVEFDADRSGRKFFDPDYTSCTGLIADIGRARFGFDTSGIGELLHWADIVDGAKFESAESAVEMKEPALKLTLVIENAAEGFIPRLIPLLTERSLAEVLAEPFVQEAVGPLWERHLGNMEVVKTQAEFREGVVFYDVLDKSRGGVSKFIPYYFYPEATYAVGVLRAGARTKISVGTNPWTRRADLVDIAEICGRFGGGGHARVGAITLEAGEEDRGREIARGIVRELRG